MQLAIRANVSSRREPSSLARRRVVAAHVRAGKSPIGLGSRVVEALLWAGACWGIWIISLSVFDAQDALIALGCAVLAGALGAAGRWAIGGSWPPDSRYWRPLARLPLAVLSDTAQVFAAAFHRPADAGFVRVELKGTRGTSPAAAGRRVQATEIASFSPGSYVIDIDEENGTVLLHSLAPRRPLLVRNSEP